VWVASDNVFGSDELSGELLRSATFTEVDGRYDASEVRTFLDRVASSVEVFLSTDAHSALRAEFARNAEIAQQVLDAGQNAAEQLRRQAAEEARQVLTDTQAATEHLRGEVEAEIQRSREQVEAMRAAFIQDLRDLYDRIGASLYRFERAAEESAVTPIAEPTRAAPVDAEPQSTAMADDVAPAQPAAPAPAPAPEREPEPEASAGPTLPAPALPELHPAAALEVAHTTAGDGLEPAHAGVAEPELPEGAKPPAWQQLPPEAWGTGPGGADESPATSGGPDEFAVVEDEPLAPGEPLVDLREMQSHAGDEFESPPTVAAPDAGAAIADVEPEPAPAPEAAVEAAAPESGGGWLDAADPIGETATPAADAAPAEPVVEVAAPAEDAGGSWLVDAPADIAGAADPGVQHDDALAEALIAGSPFGEEDGASAAPAAEVPPPLPDPNEPLAGASPEAVAVRQLVLDSLAAGQSRETIETYLRDHMGFMEPGAIVDAALTAAGDA
jgi:hypothetical protein